MKNPDQKIVIYWSWQKTVSIICALFIIPTILVLIFSATLKHTIINPNFYKKSLDKNNTYDRLIRDGIPSLILESSITDNQFSDTLSKDIIIYVVQKSVDPAWLQSIANSAIDQTAKYFAASHDKGGKIELDLSQSREFLYKVSTGLTLVNQFVPNCTEGTVGATCKNINTDEIKTNISQIQKQIDQVNLGVIDIQSYVANANSFITAIQNIIQNINVYFWVSLFILLILILVIVVLQLSDWIFAVKTVSLPMVIGSLGGLLFIWLMQPLIIGNLELLHFDLPTQMETIIIDLLKTNMFGVFHTYEWIAGSILIIFIAIYAAITILENRKIIK
jgi:hypothetical protein